MILNNRRVLATIGLLVLAVIASMPSAAQARTVRVTSTIQAAVDAAQPGDTVQVPNGTYHESVSVTKSDLTIRGGRNAVLDGAGHQYAMTVGTQLTLDPGPTCPAYGVRNVKIDGLTIQNADDTGLFMFAVDGFRVTSGRYLNNRSYGIFPRCSRDGLIDHNSGGGGDDATIYVGVNDNVTVTENNLTAGEIGIELEDTLNTYVTENRLTGNVAGILVIVLPGLPRTSTDHAVIEDNVISRNNLPNPFPPPPPFTDDLQLLPSGTGILQVGGHDIAIRDNVVNGNDTVGIGVVENPFGFGPSLNTVVTDNVVLRNGTNPDPRSAAFGDLVYDGTGTGNCFSDNAHQTDFLGVAALFPCPE